MTAMKTFISVCISMLLLVVSMPTLSSDAEAGWKPSENRFRGCAKGKKLNSVGQCV